LVNAVIMGASGKIGIEVSKALLSRGYTCILQCRKHCEKLHQLKSKGTAIIVKHDFLKEGVDSFVNTVKDKLGTIHNVLLIHPKFYEEGCEKYDEFRRHIELNLIVPSYLMLKFSKVMGEGGTIIFLTDLLASRGPNVYRSLKPSFEQIISSSGIHHAVRTAPHYLSSSVKIIGIALGWMNVENLRREDMESIKDTVPLGRPGELEELINIIIYLFENAPPYLTGTIIELSGGL